VRENITAGCLAQLPCPAALSFPKPQDYGARSSFDSEYNLMLERPHGPSALHNASPRHFLSRTLPVSHDNFSIRHRSQLIRSASTVSQ
jgi:hypothetical protein